MDDQIHVGGLSICSWRQKVTHGAGRQHHQNGEQPRDHLAEVCAIMFELGQQALDVRVGLDGHHLLVIQARSEEHTSELQSRENLVCRLLLEKKKTKK